MTELTQEWIDASEIMWEIETVDDLIDPYPGLKDEMEDRNIIPYKPNDPAHVCYNTKKCGTAILPRTEYGCHRGTCFYCQLNTKPTRKGQIIIGGLTVLSWIIFISLWVTANTCNMESQRVIQQSDHVEEALRRLPTSR